SEGNRRADQLVSTTTAFTAFSNARSSHQFFHQSAATLKHQYSISKEDARAIVAACPDCARLTPLQDGGVSPRGLRTRQLWQTDVTEFPSFGRLRFLHVSVDTHSAAIWATAS
ncbi:POK10 protein, partial [Alca torda]|nr:POK10 protein [Alca torda]